MSLSVIRLRKSSDEKEVESVEKEALKCVIPTESEWDEATRFAAAVLEVLNTSIQIKCGKLISSVARELDGYFVRMFRMSETPSPAVLHGRALTLLLRRQLHLRNIVKKLQADLDQLEEDEQESELFQIFELTAREGLHTKERKRAEFHEPKHFLQICRNPEELLGIGSARIAEIRHQATRMLELFSEKKDQAKNDSRRGPREKESAYIPKNE